MLKFVPFSKALVLLLMDLSAVKLNASSHGHVKLMLNEKNVFLHTPIINIVVMIVLIVICIHWNVHFSLDPTECKQQT